jgi:hypothetical protein
LVLTFAVPGREILLTCPKFSLWQDAQSRVYLIKELDRRTGQGHSTISVDDTLKVVACRQQGKRLASLEMELAAAKHEGFVGKYTYETNGTNSRKRPLIVIGIMTSFGRKNYRDAVRKSWLPTGTISYLRSSLPVALLYPIIINKLIRSPLPLIFGGHN